MVAATNDAPFHRLLATCLTVSLMTAGITTIGVVRYAVMVVPIDLPAVGDGSRTLALSRSAAFGDDPAGGWRSPQRAPRQAIVVSAAASALRRAR